MIRLQFYFVVCTVVFFLFTGCKNDSEPLRSTLDMVWVNKVYEYEGMVYAATEKGVWKKHIVDVDLEWEGMGLHKEYVRDVIVFDGNTLLAGIDIEYNGEGTVSLFWTVSGGRNWHSYLNNYGGGDGFTSLAAMTKHPINQDTLFITGSANVARSTDRGRHWESVFLDWNYFGGGGWIITVDPNNPQNIWTGGQNTGGGPYLAFSSNYGDTWDQINIFGQNNNMCLALSNHPTNPYRVMVGMANSVMDINAENETLDSLITITSTTPVLFRAIEASPSDLHTVYAGPQDGGTLKFYKTTDWGQSWETIEHPDGFMADVIDVLVTDHAGEDVIYLATTKGVFMYSKGEFKRF